MTPKFVTVLCDVDCSFTDFNPRYRIFVNKELFVERTWVYKQEYIEEMLQIYAPPGIYKLKFESVPGYEGKFSVSNIRVGQGSAKICDDSTLEILQ